MGGLTNVYTCIVLVHRCVRPCTLHILCRDNMEDKQRLVTRYHLTPDVLNREVSREHIIVIEQTISWRPVGKFLLEKVTLDDIQRDGSDEESRRDMMLDKWQARFGSDATYDKLIDAMISAKKIAEAEGVCELIGQ